METSHAKSAIIDRPKGFSSNVPKIFLNTTNRDQICLLPEQYRLNSKLHDKCGGNLQCSSACSSCSLPDLACDPEILLTRPRKTSGGGGIGVGEGPNQDKSALDSYVSKRKNSSPGTYGLSGIGMMGGLATNGNNNGTKLSVYCSPRISRREFAPPCVQTENHKPGEYSWLHNAEVAKFIKSEMNRRESNSSVESDSSLRSASHVSTCATSEYTHFTSCDRLSLPVHDLSSPSGNFSCPLGRLRRIYSNPEAPFLKETKSPSNENQMRDSKSCSDLENQSKPLVNHVDLERRLSNEAGHLLSPPPFIPCQLGGSQNNYPEKDSQVLPLEINSNKFTQLGSIGSPPPVEGWEEKTVAGIISSKFGKGFKEGGTPSRDQMIRQWLQGVDPAIVVSNEYSSGGHDYSGTTNATIANT